MMSSPSPPARRGNATSGWRALARYQFSGPRRADGVAMRALHRWAVSLGSPDSRSAGASVAPRTSSGSTGIWTATAYQLRRPCIDRSRDQAKARVATLTVLSTPHPRAFAWSLLRSMQGLRSWYAVAVQIPVLPELVLGATLAPALRLSGLPKETAQRCRARMATPSALRGPLNWYRASARHPLVALPLLAGGDGEDIIHVPTTYSPHRDTLDPGSLTGGGPDRRPRRSRRPGRARRCAPPRSAGVPGRSGACGRRPPSVPAAARPRRTRHRR